MVFAKTRAAEIGLKKQFEEHSVRKTYIARLTSRPSQSDRTESPEAQRIHHGSIDLPLSADYDERPRQKVDSRQGKPAHTEYETIGDNPDGTVTDYLVRVVFGQSMPHWVVPKCIFN